MPNKNVKEEARDGIVYFMDGVGTSDTTYTYPNPQSEFTLQNTGTRRLIWSVGPYSDILVGPGETVTRQMEVNTSSFTLRAEYHYQSFTMSSREVGVTVPTLTGLKEEVNGLTEQLADTAKKTEGFVNAAEFDFVGDGITLNDITPLLTYAKSKGIKTIKFPHGTFLMSGTVLVDKAFVFEGDSKETTTLSFVGVNGIETVGRIDFLQFRNIKIKGDQSLDTIGIKLNNYSSKHTFENVMVEGFGKWGIQQNGGLAYNYKSVYFISNGKNTSDEEGGSLFLAKDGTNVGTTGIFENVYCQSGGKYGLRIDGGVSHTFINTLCEYHDKAIYLNNGNRVIFINFYEEANRTTGQKVHLHDTGGTVFLLSVMSEPVYRTWAGVGAADRQTLMFTANDIEARYLTARQLKLSYYSPQSVAEDGRLQWNNKYLEIHNGTGWISHKQLLAGTTAQRPTANLKVGMDYYDTDLGKPIYLHTVSPIVWHDATGVVV